MSASSFPDSFDDSLPTSELTHPFNNGDSIFVEDSGPYNNNFADSDFVSHSVDDSAIFTNSAEDDSVLGSTDFPAENGGFVHSDAPILPPHDEMQEEGFALREWRRNGGFNLTSLIVAIIVVVLVFIFNVYLLINYQHPDDVIQAYFPKFVVVLGQFVAVISILMLLADVVNRQTCRHAFYNGACHLTLPMKDLWLAVYIVDAFLRHLLHLFRQNAIRLEEKEKREKEILSRIIEEANEFKVAFHEKRKTKCESNITNNREKEKLTLANIEKFHKEADKNYWKSIAELIPNEVPVIKKRGKKETEKKPSIAVIQGPKPGKPTDLARMRQILIKLKHDTPGHLKLAPQVGTSVNKDAESDTPPKTETVAATPAVVAA